jgi:hypothetical protein
MTKKRREHQSINLANDSLGLLGLLGLLELLKLLGLLGLLGLLSCKEYQSN